MGVIQSALRRLYDNIGFESKSRILMLGLDAAGKTTILYQLKLGENVTTIPTIGFNVETIKIGNLEMTVWDCGGQDKIRQLWHHYFQGSEAIVWVLDSTDMERMSEARHELERLRENEQLRYVPLLVYANKQDLSGALDVGRIVQALGLKSIAGMHGSRHYEALWHVEPCVGVTGSGLLEGMQKLCSMIKEYRTHQPKLQTLL